MGRVLLFCVVCAAAAAGGWGEGHAGMPALTEAQRIQLETADDARPPDEPAWTGLLTNVAAWDPAEAAAGFVPGAMVPDFGELLAEPATHRGGLFVLEGRYAGRQREMRTLRAGAWGESLKEWGVVVSVRASPQTSDHEASASARAPEVVAMLYMVDPEGEVVPPREGQTVRLAARFYKLWTDVDADGVERTYPVFVGRSASVVSRAAGGLWGSGLIVGGVVVMTGVLFLVMLARGRSRRGASQRERVLERLRQEADAFEDDAADEDSDEITLPNDPAAALEQLEQSRRDD